MYSHLGGGIHGHLVLVLTAAQYSDIYNTVFTRPSHLGPLAIPPVSTVVQRITLRDDHVEDLQVFREVMGVEQALIQKIVATIDATYLTDIQYRTTNSINISVLDLIVHLQDTYGTLMPHDFQEKEDEAKKMVYNPRDPTASVFWLLTT